MFSHDMMKAVFMPENDQWHEIWMKKIKTCPSLLLQNFALKRFKTVLILHVAPVSRIVTVSVLFSLFLYITFSNFDSIMHSLCICNLAVKFYLSCVQVVMIIHISLSHNMYCITFFASPKFGAFHADRYRNTGVVKHIWCKSVWFCLITLPQAQLAWWQQYSKSFNFFKDKGKKLSLRNGVKCVYI